MGLDDKVIEERTGLGPQGTKGLITGVWIPRLYKRRGENRVWMAKG